jgi:riboflavin biosynthesis pyrimidine reductase
MFTSIDGRIVLTRWGIGPMATKAYERTAATLNGDGWIIGRISMEPYAGKARVPKTTRKIARKDFIASHDADSYAIAIDPSGKLTWRSNDIDGEHVITILTEGVSDDYLAFLQSKGVSYLFGGRTKIDLKRVLSKLARHFGIKRLLLEGGGKINGSFLAAGLIDELSVLVGPIADGGIGTPTLFDAKEGLGTARRMKLQSVERLESDIVWLRYKMMR